MSETALTARLLDVIERDILPLTAQGVAQGNKVFGAAILRKSDLSLVLAETNNELENPLWHGEMHALKRLHELPKDQLPDPKECIFLTTHEPCSLCLSAITWAGFDNFYYFFSYEDTRDAFSIPHDLKILDEVFKLPNGEYRKDNEFWRAMSISDMIANAPDGERSNFQAQKQRINAQYDALSEQYQSSKSDQIPLA